MASIETQRGALIDVEVAYALPQRQRIIGLQVPEGCTAFEAVQRSGITLEFPDIDPETADMGIFSKSMDGKVLPLPKEYRLKARDRIEIYRPLIADPKAARQARATRVKEERGQQEE
jgi:putative ubiquitin-RnfH superfamily antitoxin RatB of RatAB toxin-antitoxin module